MLLNVTANFPELAKGVVFICSPWPGVKLTTYVQEKLRWSACFMSSMPLRCTWRIFEAIPSTKIVYRRCQK